MRTSQSGTYSRLEDTLVAPIRLGGLADLILAGVRVHNTVLTGDLVTVALAVLALLLLVGAQLALEVGLLGANLLVLERFAAVRRAACVGSEELQLVADTAVQGLSLGDEALQLLGRQATIGFGKGTLVKRCNGLDIGGQGADLLAQVTNPLEEILLRKSNSALRLLRVGL